MSDYIVFGQPILGDEEIAEVTDALRSCWIGTGPRTARFEDQFADYVGARHAVAVNSCTAALHLSLLASGVGPGDEVITTPLTFASTANVILHAGAMPVFVDVDRETMNIDPSQIEAAITQNTKAILPVHFGGRPCEMEAIGAIADRFGLKVIEDAAHCIEGRYQEQKIGSISPLTCFSFYVTKNMTTAEGGMIATNDEQLATTLKMHALHGLSRDAWRRFSDDGYQHYEVVYPGFKYNMTDLQAALGLCQLPKLEQWLRRREEIWQQYDEAFAELPCWVPSPAASETRHARHLYTLLLDIDQLGKSRDQVMQELHELGIGVGVHYRAVHLHQYYRERYGYEADQFPNANWISQRTISLPLSAKLTADQVDRIISAMTSTLSVTQLN
ncbi:DegT/DnrJ/EryC1/StrS aminotransferase family protein [Bremerella sp. JC817]|uniref:DegT/DnrJ/EryC1/StrS family aminotransferase n=1 Tax=Bremerella sp. JC817 TaxID=3231756 RepID=UPI00345A07E4